jgi:transcriptional regulator with XRE-family HTH domain
MQMIEKGRSMARGRRKSARSKAAVVEWIRLLMRKRDWSATELARSSGIAPSTLLRALNNPDYRYVFSLRTLQKIAGGAGEPIPHHLAGNGQEIVPSLSGSTWDQPSGRYRMVEVRSVSALPAKAQSAVKLAKPEVIAAPFHLENDETIFAFRNPDESLGAWFRPRSLMFATKARDPTGGDIIMITSKGRTTVRLLLGVTENGLSLSKTMPPKEDEKISFDEIGDIAVIVEVATG